MKDKDPIFRSLAMIEERIQDKLTVEMLAEGVHFSKYHYQRIFRETMGETVMGYVTRRRLFLAAEDLAGTKDPVIAIALKYSYNSHEGFTRSFKAYLGVTPTEYRKYHSAISFPGAKKEEGAMWNSKITDGISAHFLIIKAVEDATFEANVTAFQVGLMVARAMPEHRAAFQPLCEEYDRLAQNARISSGKIVDFLNELSTLIFQDIRKNAAQKVQDAVEAGMEAGEKLSDPSLPYGYIADGVQEIAEELDSLALEEMTAYFLEDTVFRIETILFAADMDILRAPQHRQLFDGIVNFKEKLGEAAEFFRNLSGDATGIIEGVKKDSEIKRTAEKKYSDLAVQEGILLFYNKSKRIYNR